MSLSLGIDVGTSGVRTAMVDEKGEVLAQARVDHLPQETSSINAELWWQAVQNCIESQIRQMGQSDLDSLQINRIAVDGTSGTMVLTDASLVPVSPALMYDSKGFAAEAELIAQHAPQQHITQGPSSALGRAMRLASDATNASHLMHQADFIAAKLMNRGGLSDFNNALKTGFDPETEQWPDWIDQVLDPKLLPQVKSPGAEFGQIDSQVASDLNLSPQTVIYAGTTDSIAAFFAAAPFRTGAAVTSLGSTLAVKLLCNKRIDDPASGLYSHKIGNAWLAGGASNTGGAVINHHFSLDEIESLSEKIDVDKPSGLDYYPLIKKGERFPINDPELEPRVEPRPDDDALFLQGLLEGIARIETQCYRQIEKRGGQYPSEIYSAGGAAKSQVFTAIRANFLGQRPLQSDQNEAAVGAARIAAGFLN